MCSYEKKSIVLEIRIDFRASVDKELCTMEFSILSPMDYFLPEIFQTLIFYIWELVQTSNFLNTLFFASQVICRGWIHTLNLTSNLELIPSSQRQNGNEDIQCIVYGQLWTLAT